MRRPSVVLHRIFPRHAFEFPVDEPDLFGRGGHAFEIVNAGMRDERLEFEIADRCCGRAANRPYSRRSLLRPHRYAFLSINGFLTTSATPFMMSIYALPPQSAGDLIDEFLSITCRTAGIRHKDDVALVCKNLRIPAVTPTVAPCALRPSMDKNDQRIFLCSVKIRGF